MTSDVTPSPHFPDVARLLLETPLYTQIVVGKDPETRSKLGSLRKGPIQLDAHCVFCGQASIFKTKPAMNSGGIGAGVTDPEWMLKSAVWSVEIYCSRTATHSYRYYFGLGSGVLRKVGQWPSLEDIAGADIEKYRSQLKDHFRELKTATGLASHGVGIGAFVYLRRIFERLIRRHHDELPSPVSGFEEMRMDKRINALKSVLPPALVTNRATYAILSKGVHDLDEQTCQLYFPVIRSAIIQILEQDFQKRSAAKAEAELATHIAEIHRQLKSADGVAGRDTSSTTGPPPED